MSRFRNDQGPTTEDDPQRLVFYGMCNYWTDDWSLLSRTTTSRIPCCPRCKSVGFQDTYESWMLNAERFEQDNHERYCDFLERMKETCLFAESRRTGRNANEVFMDKYARFTSDSPEIDIVLVSSIASVFVVGSQIGLPVEKLQRLQESVSEITVRVKVDRETGKAHIVHVVQTGSKS